MEKILMCVWAALCLPMFVSCEDDDDESVVSNRHNRIEWSDNIFVSEILVNQTLLDLYDIKVTYDINGHTISEFVDFSGAEKRTAFVNGSEYDVLGVLATKKITDRPVKVLVTAHLKDSFESVLSERYTDKVDLIYFAKSKTVKTESDVAFSNYFMDFSIKTSIGVSVDKLKDNKRTLQLGLFTMG